MCDTYSLVTSIFLTRFWLVLGDRFGGGSLTSHSTLGLALAPEATSKAGRFAQRHWRLHWVKGAWKPIENPWLSTCHSICRSRNEGFPAWESRGETHWKRIKKGKATWQHVLLYLAFFLLIWQRTSHKQPKQRLKMRCASQFCKITDFVGLWCTSTLQAPVAKAKDEEVRSKLAAAYCVQERRVMKRNPGREWSQKRRPKMRQNMSGSSS